MSIDTAVVLAAGEGRRLRPLTRHRPKPMLPIGNRPILEYVFDTAIDAGVERLHVVVGYRRTRVQDHFGSTYRDVPLSYHVQDKQLGSGHALLQVRGAVEGPCLVLNGDQLAASEMVTDVQTSHEAGDAPASLGVVESGAASQYGSVIVDDGQLVELVERPGDDGEYSLLNAGVYAFDPGVFQAMAATPRVDGSITMPGVIQQLLETGHDVAAIRTEGYWSDATYPWDLPSVTRAVLSRGLVSTPERRAGVRIAETATVHDSATLRPPVVLSDDATIGPGAVIGPNVALGRNTTVESNAVVRDTVVDDDVRIGATSVAVDSVLSQGVVLGPGCMLAGGEADVTVGDRVYRDRRLGAVLADRVRLHAGVTCRPGVLVGPEATVAEGVSLSTNVEAESEVRH